MPRRCRQKQPGAPSFTFPLTEPLRAESREGSGGGSPGLSRLPLNRQLEAAQPIPLNVPGRLYAALHPSKQLTGGNPGTPTAGVAQVLGCAPTADPAGLPPGIPQRAAAAPRSPSCRLRSARLGWVPPPSSPRPGAAPPRTELPWRRPPRCQRRGVRAAPRAPAAPIRAARRPRDPRRPADRAPPAGRHAASAPALAPVPAQAGLEPAAQRALRGGGGGSGDRKRLRAAGGNQRAGTRVWDLPAGRGQRSPAGQRQRRAPAAEFGRTKLRSGVTR